MSELSKMFMEQYISLVYLLSKVSSHCARLIQGAQVNNMRTIGKKQLIEGASYLTCATYSGNNYGI